MYIYIYICMYLYLCIHIHMYIYLYLHTGEKWRRELVKEITKKISAIQNASLGEHRVREINDEINKLNKTKTYWDERIIELGGGGNTRRKQFYDVEGKELYIFICICKYMRFYFHLS
jgi:hypothetical protein